jgi:hypothetical protein
VLTSTAFIQLAQASTNGVSGSSSSSGAVLRLGDAVQGKADAASWFQDVLLGPQGLPVVLLLEGLQVAKDLRWAVGICCIIVCSTPCCFVLWHAEGRQMSPTCIAL